MSEKITVPSLGESVTEATVSKWLKSQGDKVLADEPIVELETDKVNVEVPAPINGVLGSIDVKEGETVNVGSLLGTISNSSSAKTVKEIKNYNPPKKTPLKEPKLFEDNKKDVEEEVLQLKNEKVEVVPVELADFITKNTKMITMGMGCGDVCDTQYLFCNDILGINTGHYPRHAKKYVDLKKEEEKLQELREKGFKMFLEDMKSGNYPEDKHLIKMDLSEFEKFQSKIK